MKRKMGRPQNKVDVYDLEVKIDGEITLTISEITTKTKAKLIIAEEKNSLKFAAKPIAGREWFLVPRGNDNERERVSVYTARP